MHSFTHDPRADAVYIQLNDHPVALTKELDEARMVDYDAAGQPTGVEFLFVSQGIALSQVPEAGRIAMTLADAGFALLP